MSKYLHLRDSVITHIQKLKKEFLVCPPGLKKKGFNWRSVNKLLGRSVRSSVDVDVHELADYFSSIFLPAPSQLDIDLGSLPSCPIVIDFADVRQTLRSLKKSSPGPDFIPYWILRDFCDNLAPAVFHVCRLSAESCLVPPYFKDAFISPIPKCPKPSIMDYRPISLLPIMSKVLEKIILRRFVKDFSSSIDPLQFAFVPRKGQGTVSALTFIVHKIVSFLDTPGAVRLLTLDFTKAFDRVPHATILHALVRKGASKELVTWTKSYLAHRFQRVRVGDNISQPFHAISGVPQGSVLGPFLFALCIDDLQPKFHNTCFVKFADDVCVLHFIREKKDDLLSQEYDSISLWCSRNGLSLNAKKTKLMNFHTKQSIPLQPIYDHDSNIAIETVHVIKLLGIHIDDRFSWDAHVQYVLSKIRKRVFLLYSLRQAKASQSIISTVYSSLIRSLMTYSFPAWCNIASSRFSLLERFEKRICRLFCFELETSLIDNANKYAIGLANKCLHNQHPLHTIFDFSATRYSARLGSSHRKVFAKSKRYKNSFIRFANSCSL